MSLAVASCPVSWGVEVAGDERVPSAEQFLSASAAAGCDGVELGPLGYLPDAAGMLEAHGLRLAAGYVMEPLSDPAALDRTRAVARNVARRLQRDGAELLIVIDALAPERIRAGTVTPSPLPPTRFEQLCRATEEIALIAEQAGLRAAFHPHAGTHVEIEPEIERLLAAVDVGICLDSGHNIYGGVDPLALFDRHRDRLLHVHLKDVDGMVLARARQQRMSFLEAVADGLFRPLGDGVVNLPPLLERLTTNGYAGWLAIEQDRRPLMAAATTPAEDLARSLARLRALMERGEAWTVAR